MTDSRAAEYNVVATYHGPLEARRALQELKTSGVPASNLSFLSRDDEAAVSEKETQEQTAEMPAELGKNAAVGGAAGGAAGGLLGFVAGAAAFGIPGVGPAVGAGIWAATAGGAAAGATAGGMISGIEEMWTTRYRDAVNEGRVLVGVHSGDEGEVAKAATILEGVGANRIDRFDAQGRPLG
ncbi:MAG: hypothetical protein M3454_08830 [Actinomycetota bacterium]|nr:hypothetical protein [Actinomycetota bacterium]